VRPLPRRPPADSGRAAAFAVLEGVEFHGGSSNTLLAEIDVRDERERHLATSVVYGVLRQRRTLDRLIEKTSSRPLAEIDPATLIALRLALFQILFLTRVPRSAAVNEAVSLVRARRGRGAAAFANGVLRSACRLLDGGLEPQALLPDASRDPALFLAEKYSFPLDLVARYLRRFGPEECEALLATLNRPAPTVLRLVRGAGSAGEVTSRLRDEGVEAVPSPILPDALRVIRGAPQRTRTFRDGLIYIQDEAAQIVALLLLPIEPGGGLLDLCASPGGKFLAAAQSLPPGARMVAADVSQARLRLLEDNARRLRIPGIHEVVTDAALPGLRGDFARVLLDAPCSGTGVIRRHPEIRWRRGLADISAAAGAQARTLRAAAELVAPSGRLVYSVCSLEPEEGRERIDELLRARDDFDVVDARTVLPSTLHRLVDDAGFLSTLPHRDDVDGFFAAVLRKTQRVVLGAA
jgi:16S rRNA (cytosine967-C5)-methyltransferase